MKENRSFFWPLTLIAAGVIWLMISMGRVPASNLWALTHIWPFLLIALGVGLILRGLWRPLGAVVSTLVVIGAAAAVVFAPQMGWDKAQDWQWAVNDSFGGAIPGSGKIKTETRIPGEFNAIAIRYPGTIVVQQGDKNLVVVEADDNLLPQLTTEVRGGTLIIQNSEENYSKRVSSSRTVTITITVKDVKEIAFSAAGKLEVNGLKTGKFDLRLSGAGDAILNGLELDTLAVSLSGAGKITAAGTSNNLSVSISGLGDFEGTNLQVHIAEIQISGAGTATVRASDTLEAKVSGAGTVNYYGSPKVTQTISGAGSVNQMGK